MNKKICIIGNNNFGRPIRDGGRIKIRLYYELLMKEKFDVQLVDLASFTKRFIVVYHQIKTAIKNNDVIVIMAGPKGCRFIIPLVNHLNKRYHRRVIFVPLGIGTIDYLIKNANIKDREKILSGDNSFHLIDKRMNKHLTKLDGIYVENNKLLELYKTIYQDINCDILVNFRTDNIVNNKSFSAPFTIIYFSRVKEDKGVLDLINAVQFLLKDNIDIKLDIYGEMQLSENEHKIFHKYLNEHIRYKGVVEQDEAISLIANYSLFVLPTKYYGEGTSGSLIESFFALTPALISGYSQAQCLIEDGKDGLIYEFNNVNDLKQKILYCYNHVELLKNISSQLKDKAKQYTYEYNRLAFIKAVTGE